MAKCISIRRCFLAKIFVCCRTIVVKLKFEAAHSSSIAVADAIVCAACACVWLHSHRSQRTFHRKKSHKLMPLEKVQIWLHIAKIRHFRHIMFHSVFFDFGDTKHYKSHCYRNVVAISVSECKVVISLLNMTKPECNTKANNGCNGMTLLTQNQKHYMLRFIAQWIILMNCKREKRKNIDEVLHSFFDLSVREKTNLSFNKKIYTGAWNHNNSQK